MFPKKIPKNQQPDKNFFTVHLSDFSKEKLLSSNQIRFVSIDPGIKNFAICVCRRTKQEKKIELWLKVNFSMFLTTEIDSEKSLGGYSKLYSEVSIFLEKQRKFFENINIVLIERQLPTNYKMVRLSQHVLSYFTNLFLSNPIPIIEIDSKFKTKFLDAPRKLDEREVKKWSVEKCSEILPKYFDQVSENFFTSFKKKKDDLADTIVQMEAFCRYFSLFEV
jgi:hypothetical protein